METRRLTTSIGCGRHLLQIHLSISISCPIHCEFGKGKISESQAWMLKLTANEVKFNNEFTESTDHNIT
jgi:hypothetical protein